ncbi:ketoacyl-ACP synthase III [Daejeonella sp. JGW-45]|uniref:ketoacyl-ACP synthase III n=1 Tax=Daejeonella sp. JGW-45 TaxID=3034148 RepID=UPI0023EC1FA8|nr:ketoacyl-ACP synthase III [Daejeonella sp. JGW-45]
MNTGQGCEIKAIEFVFPQKVVTNSDLSKEFPDYNFSLFEAKVGIKNRYVVSGGETALDLAKQACDQLFKNIDQSNIDYIIYCTQSPEYILPTSACILQDLLSLKTNIGALDINLGCSGYTYGLTVAKGLILSGQATNVLLVTAETYSKYLHPGDRSNRAIFGDAASATLVGECSNEGIGKFVFGTDGSGYNKLIIKNGGGRNSYQTNADLLSYGTDNLYTDNHLYMDGPEIFNFTSEKVPRIVNDLAEINNLKMPQINQTICHQANAVMLELIRKKCKISKDSFYIDLADGGNTVSNTIPIALKRYSQGLDQSETVALVGFGVGLSWCGGIINLKHKL